MIMSFSVMKGSCMVGMKSTGVHLLNPSTITGLRSKPVVKLEVEQGLRSYAIQKRVYPWAGKYSSGKNQDNRIGRCGDGRPESLAIV